MLKLVKINRSHLPLPHPSTYAMLCNRNNGFNANYGGNTNENLSRNLENLKDVENQPNYTFVKADICDSAAITKIFDENDIDRVVHFAAESHVDRSIKNPEVFVKTNVLGTLVMLNAAKAAWELPDGSFKEDKKFLYVSTDEVYGSLDDGDNYFYETTPFSPHSPYSASKASGDMLTKAYFDTYKFPCNITSCSNNYGPFQFPEKLIPLVISGISFSGNWNGP